MLTYEKQEEWKIITGFMQSPIDIKTASCKKMRLSGKNQIHLNYNQQIEAVEEFFYNHIFHSLGQAEIWSRKYDLVQYHFHAPSEHAIDGKKFDLEGHFVHTGKNGQLAVIGVFFTIGKENQAFEEVLLKMEGKSTFEVKHIMDFFPENKQYYHYLGSLTTPPLTESVEWFIFKETKEISLHQLKRFEKIHNCNCRNLQPEHARLILDVTE
ncbi:MAG: carbonic anhydrase family protein [Streptococcaceae bacterium]|jgi:carbonic anhydrase|nr:carbonic anhydrase family protein [Streptococcaceae bacterium]